MTTKRILPLKKPFGVCLFALLMLFGCSPATTLPFPSIPTPSQTHSAVVEPSPVIATPTPISTPQPTLPPEQVKDMILNLLESNGGCRLPCWWGIVPRETSIQEVLSFFAPFASDISVGDTGVAVYFFTYPDEFSEEFSHDYIAFGFQTFHGIVSHIGIHGIRGAPYYHLSQFLNMYGQPDEIWIRTFSPNPGEIKVTFSVIAFYGNQGIVAYWQGAGEVQGKTIHGCIESSPGLYLWSPDPVITTITDTSRLFDPILPGGALRLIEASGMNEETFYETFRDVAGSVCLDTPTSLWLGVYGQAPSP